MKKWLIFSLQALVTIALLAWLFSKQDQRAHAWEVLRNAHAGWLLAGLAVGGVGNLLGAFRWGIFLRLQGIYIPAGEVFRLSFIGLFFNNFLLGAVGGDVVKIVWLVAKGYHRRAATLSAVMDRLSGVGALVICSSTFMWLRIDWLCQSAVVARVVHGIFIYLAVIVVLLVLSLLVSRRGFTDLMPQRLPGRAQIIEFSAAYLKFVAAWPGTLLAMFISAVILLSYFFTFFCAARAFGVQMPLLDFMALMPAVDIITALPVSLGGFGVRETVLATLMGDLSAVPPAQAAAIGLGGALLYMAWGLVGAVMLPSYRRVAARAAETQTM